MRLIALILAAFAASSSAYAQSWKEYTYPAYSFAVSFPQEPRVETTTYQSAGGRAVQARVYSVTQDGSVLKMTIADLPDGNMEEKTVIDHAIKTMSEGGEIKVNITHEIDCVYGRQLSISGADGSHNSVAVFFHKQRLYQIEGRAAAADGTADAIRFQQSLTFTDDTTNRSPVGRLFETIGRLF